MTVSITENTTECAFVLRKLFTTFWRSDIHMNLKIDDDALNRRRRRFCVRLTICHIYQRQCRHMLVSAHASAVYAVRSIKSKTNKSYRLYFQL